MSVRINPLAFPFVKTRWLTLASVVGAAAYVLNNYQIQGLDGLRLEPRPSASGGSGIPSWPGSLPTSQLPTGPWLNTSSTNPPLPGSNTGLPTTAPYAAPGFNGAGLASSPTLPSTSGGGAPPKSLADKILTPLGLPEGKWQTLNPFGSSSTSDHSTNSGLGMTVDMSSGAPVAPLRIASFNVCDLDAVKRERMLVKETLVRILSQFDLIALQEIRARQDNVLPELVAAINATGKQYDFLIGPRVGRGEFREQYAFVFDTNRIETDRFQLYTVDDPEDMLNYEPLVGWFRAKGLPAQTAFTFSLVSLRFDPDYIAQEANLVPDLLRSIAADGRGEDDIILAGDFGIDAARTLANQDAGIRAAIDGIATTTRGTHAQDNFLFSATATTEYSGRAGAFDFLRQFNMSLEQALEVSDHLPVWIEFMPVEGGRPGQVAASTLLKKSAAPR